MLKKELKKRIELGVDTKKVKVQFNTSKPEFREVMGKYWVAVVELADMTKIYGNNVRILSESVSALEEKAEKKGLSESDVKRLELDKAQLAEYNAKFEVYREEMNKRFNECYELILTSGLYDGYNLYATKQDKSSFKESLKLFLASHSIEVTPSLVDFLLSVVGLRVAPANTKVKTKGTTLLIAQTPRRFNELFMHALAQLMVDKNCLKTDLYKFTYEKASEVHIHSQIDDIIVPSEEETPSVESVDEVSDYDALTTKQLKEVAKKHNIKGASKMKKDELLTILKTTDAK